MEANELMIGDWVYYIHTEDGIAPYKEVICIQAEDLCRDACIIETHYEPIPLTAEILEKNGFKKDTGGKECWANSKGWFTHHEYGKRDTIKSWEVEICGKINSFDGVIKYVHELQHALRLCGIEKEITI